MTTRAEAAYRRSLAAFKTPTLDLLHGRYAPFVVAALSLVFTAERPSVPIPDAHTEITEILEQLQELGYQTEGQPRLPSATARELCGQWVKVGWLMRQIDGETEVYRLTAHAVGALEIAGRTGTGTRVSRSRVRTLLDAVDRLADNAESNPVARLARLQEERSALDAQIEQLVAGGVPEPIPEETLLEEAEHVMHLARELPADFARVAESIKSMQRDVVADLRQDVRPTAEVLREYLQRGQYVMEATPEGRAFAGALRLIGNPEHIDQLAEQLGTLLGQPFAQALTAEQRDELRAIGRRLELGVQEVLTAQRRASQVITAQVRTHDPVRDRQVDELLREVMSGLQLWMESGGRSSDPVDPLLSLPMADIGHLRQSLSDIAPPKTPDPLGTAEDVEFVPADTRSWGGPHYRELEAYLNGLGAEFDLGQAFDGVPAEARRPVDLLGLLELAHRNGMTENDEVSIVEARRPDGSTRKFAFGAVTARTTKEHPDD